MNRLLTYLSAAVCFAAGTASSAFAAPSGEPAANDRNTSLVANGSYDAVVSHDAEGSTVDLRWQGVRSRPSLTASELIRSSFDRGFATIDSSSQTSPVRGGIMLMSDPLPNTNVRLTSDVSEFISPQWLRNDGAVAAYSALLPEGEALPFAQPAMFASPDAQILSVPEIPLPLGVIPGLIGVGLAAIAHRWSLSGQKRSR